MLAKNVPLLEYLEDLEVHTFEIFNTSLDTFTRGKKNDEKIFSKILFLFNFMINVSN